MNANDITAPETVSVDQFKSKAMKIGPGGIRRLALITVINKPQVIFSDEPNAAPAYDESNEVLGATNLGKGFMIVGRQRSEDDLENKLARYEAVMATIPKTGQTTSCNAIVDETLTDIVYELYDDVGDAEEIKGLTNTEVVDQKLRIQAFVFETKDGAKAYVGSFDAVIEDFQSGEYFANLKFIDAVPTGTKLVRMDGKLATKLPSGEFRAYNLDGSRDHAYDNLPKIPDSTMVLQAIDENGDFKQGWMVAKYYGDEDIVSYAANAETESDDELKKFLEDWNNTPIGKTQQKMHAAPETYRAK